MSMHALFLIKGSLESQNIRNRESSVLDNFINRLVFYQHSHSHFASLVLRTLIPEDSLIIIFHP